jgi:TonB family protein
MNFMHTPQMRFGAALLASASLLGCSTPQNSALHPVENPVPSVASDVYDVSKVEVLPRPMNQIRPIYPDELRSRRIDGQGVIAFTVKTDGQVGDAVIVRATDIRFGESAMAAVLKWHFTPAMIGGRPVNCRMVVPVSFSVSDD